MSLFLSKRITSYISDRLWQSTIFRMGTLTNEYLQCKRYQNTVRVKLNVGRMWQLVICGEKFYHYFLKDGGKCRFLPKIYICILPGQDDILIE